MYHFRYKQYLCLSFSDSSKSTLHEISTRVHQRHEGSERSNDSRQFSQFFTRCPAVFGLNRRVIVTTRTLFITRRTRAGSPYVEVISLDGFLIVIPSVGRSALAPRAIIVSGILFDLTGRGKGTAGICRVIMETSSSSFLLT